MDLLDICAVTSTGDSKQCVNKKNKAWHKRLHLRKTVAEPSTMQCEDKSGPKKIAEEWERSPAWSSSKKSLQEAQQSHTTLRFACSQCRDNMEYVPKDLVRHFEEKHKGSPPVFPCHTCTFHTNEFSFLQVHLLSHKDTFSSCIICNDNVQRTSSEFSTHLTMCHCQNGKYLCEKCQTFSTSDVHLFLAHMCVHDVHFEEDGSGLSLHTKGNSQPGPKTTQKLHCQHCDYEASQKWLITKHIKAVHVCNNGNQRKKKKEVHSLAIKPNDPIPKMKPRLTRSAVREMCWLTQDCLSLPGREFLDKYCHLSGPQTTLEETQQFLKKSVTRETSDQKWTKALKTVLSNVPQDLNLHPKSENGLTLNSDLTVLTVKNKITVAQNGASYSKRFKRMTPSDKATLLPESAADDACCVVDQNGCQPNLNEHALCTQTETKLHNDIAALTQNESLECAQMQENRENRELETQEEHSKHPESVDEDGNNVSSELKLTNEYEEQPSIRKVQPKRKKSQRWKRRIKYKKVDKRSSALKIVLKKNPVKEKQWVSESSLSTSGGGSTGNDLQDLHKIEKMQTRASKNNLPDPTGALTSVSHMKPGIGHSPSCAVKPTGSKNMNGNEPVGLEGSLLTYQEIQVDAEMSPQQEVEKRNSTAKMNQSHMRATAETGPENAALHTGRSMDDYVSEEEGSGSDGLTPLSSYTRPSPVLQPGITSQGESNLEDSSLALSVEQCEPRVEGIREGELTIEPSSFIVSNNCSTVEKAIQQEPSPASGHAWQPVPKNLERTLKLVAINPSQLVKRPAGDQPVVVLNHPDADIPEVARIMEVVKRYRGEVQKVVLSRRTLKALSAMNGEVPKTVALSDFGKHCKNSVQERFILKLKLRRLSRRKYEVVGAASPCRDATPEFRCWFCGRVFESQEVWMVHRQRHLME